MCRPGSEMQQVFREIAALEYDEPPHACLRFAVAMKMHGEENLPIGWAAICRWQDAPALQGFVFPNYRQRGLASALVSAITVDGDVPLEEGHVFSEQFASIATRAGFRTVKLWKRVEDEWVKS